MQEISLEEMFHPKSVALIGASIDPGKLGTYPLQFFTTLGYGGQVYPVNPKYKEIAGRRCYASLSDIPGKVDLAVISLPAGAAVEALEECGARGVRASVIISSGFAEAGAEGRQLQERLRQVAQRYNMAVMGPNCVGFINWPERVTASFISVLEEGMLPEGNACFITQSGALSGLVVKAAKERGLGLRYLITTGNEAVLTLTDYAHYIMQTDPDIGFILGYIENISDGEAFKVCARRALELGKPLIFLKAGRSEEGARATASHTGSITGADDVYQAVFSRYGVIRAGDLDEWLDIAVLCQAARWPRGDRVGILTLSGAVGALMVDTCAETGLHLAKLAPETREGLKKVLPPFASVENPVDITAQIRARPEVFKEPLRLVAEDPNVDMVAVFIGAARGGEKTVAEGMAEIARRSSKPILVSWLPLPGTESLAIMQEAGIPYFSEPSRALGAMGKLREYVAKRERFLSGSYLNTLEGIEAGYEQKVKAIRQIFTEVRSQGRLVLTEAEAKAVLQEWGLPVPRGEVVSSLAEAEIAARRLGWPVVMKGSSPDVVHKTDFGLVKLGLPGLEEVRSAFWELVAGMKGIAGEHAMLVEEMITGNGVEVMLGARNDSRFGPVITFGLGGIFVEILRDIVVWPAPVSVAEALEIVQRTKGYRVLEGFRKRPAADLESLAEGIHQVSLLVYLMREDIAELDINPLFVREKGMGFTVEDALIVLTGPSHAGAQDTKMGGCKVGL
ncbi:MAG: CoA-binding protein [Clostridia bacterium]|nr:MAG: CoA-binding protein [Clostridia bacterium]